MQLNAIKKPNLKSVFVIFYKDILRLVNYSGLFLVLYFNVLLPFIQKSIFLGLFFKILERLLYRLCCKAVTFELSFVGD